MVVATRAVAKNQKRRSHFMIREDILYIPLVKQRMPQYHQYRRKYEANRFVVVCVRVDGSDHDNLRSRRRFVR